MNSATLVFKRGQYWKVIYPGGGLMLHYKDMDNQFEDQVVINYNIKPRSIPEHTKLTNVCCATD